MPRIGSRGMGQEKMRGGWHRPKRYPWGVAASVMACLAPLPAVSPASAAQHHPKGVFGVFSDCPLSDPAVSLCVVANISSGEFIFGKKTVPIDKAITLRAGLVSAGGLNFNEYTLAGAEDGDTLSRTVLSIPGGLVGVGGATRTTEVTTIAELANPVSRGILDAASFGEERGTALRLPLKLKLSSPLLGSACSIGSDTNPIVLNLTDGTTSPPAPNRPVKGTSGKIRSVFEKGNELSFVSDASLVDDAFGVPAVTGCSRFYSSLIDSDVGLPSPAGRNTAILSGNFDLAEATQVEANE